MIISHLDMSRKMKQGDYPITEPATNQVFSPGSRVLCIV